ncbi:MAG TPA: DUF2971 domain-containing protein [Terracidiphilus sp.]|nr:DUF2971 domain-containing protein [Terracidiphilus sp.]
MEEHKENADQAKPELLFHYTRQRGLDGILSSQRIWATHYRFLNDSMERRLGLEMYKDAIFKIALERFKSEKSAKTLVDYLQRLYTGVDAYVVSFCASYTKNEFQEKRQVEDGRGGDRLSQWRGYAPGVQGYCLAFDFKLVRQIRQLPENHNCCYDAFCTYSEDSDDQGENETLEMVTAHVKEWFESQSDQFAVDDLKNPESLQKVLSQDQTRNNKVMRFVLDMLLVCGIFKHIGFQEENEYRLIKWIFQHKPDTEKMCFRSENIPYVEFPLQLATEDSTLRAIFVGPSANKDQAAHGLQLRLKEMGLSHVEVVPSKIPYRNW